MKETHNYEEEMRLIQKAKEGDEASVMALIHRYEPLFKKLCAGETHMEWEDIRQELSLSFLESLAAYDPSKGIYFGYYIKQRLYWKKIALITASIKRREKEIHSMEETEAMGKEDSYEEKSLSQKLNDLAHSLPLSPKEKLIFQGLMKGEKPAHLIKKLGTGRTSYYRCRASLMKKLIRNRDRLEA